MKKHFFYLIALAALAGCKDEPEQIPAYLRIEPFTVNEQGGAAWQQITDGWLYVNGEFLGAYTLPATVPVLAAGESDIIVFPGVKENGIAFTPNIYPFLSRYETKTNFAPPGIATLQPNTQYDDGARFPWASRGDLDGTSTLQFENRDDDNAVNFALSSDGAFAGKSLLMTVDTAHALMEVATEKVADLPTSGDRQVWLEMHHRNDIPFALLLVGVTGSNENGQLVYEFNVSDDWNKIYLNLTDFLTASLKDEYRLYFHVSLPRNEAGKFSQPEGKVLLDNIRLVYF